MCAVCVCVCERGGQQKSPKPRKMGAGHARNVQGKAKATQYTSYPTFSTQTGLFAFKWLHPAAACGGCVAGCVAGRCTWWLVMMVMSMVAWWQGACTRVREGCACTVSELRVVY